MQQAACRAMGRYALRCNARCICCLSSFFHNLYARIGFVTITIWASCIDGFALTCRIFFSFFKFPPFAIVKCISDLGDYVIHRIFFVFSYVTYAECHSANFFRKCCYCYYTSSFLFDRKTTYRSTIHRISSPHHSCLIAAAIFNGFPGTSRLDHFFRTICSNRIFYFFHIGGKEKSFVARKLREELVVKITEPCFGLSIVCFVQRSFWLIQPI